MTTLRKTLVDDLPQPLARLYLRAYNATDWKLQHDNAYYLLEATLKLMGAMLVGAYIKQGAPSAKLNKDLESLTMPSTGHWVGFARETARTLSKMGRSSGASRDSSGGDSSASISSAAGSLTASSAGRDLAGLADFWEELNKKRDDLPACREALVFFRKAAELEGGAGNKISPLQFWDAFPGYRNAVLGHGASRSESFYEEGFNILISAAEEIFTACNPFADRSLLVADSVKVGSGGEMRVNWKDLRGQVALPLRGLAFDDDLAGVRPGRLYFAGGGRLSSVHPLVIYEADELQDRVLFLNKAPSEKKLQYLSYDTGRTLSFRDQPEDLKRLLADLRQLLEALRGASLGHSEFDALTGEEEGRERSGARLMGDFEIERVLGTGGMGEVYLARQLSLDREVALKVLPKALSKDTRAVGRFLREIQVLSMADHPNVIKIYTSGESGGTHYYAMEYLRGADLARVIDSLKNISRTGDESLSDADIDRAIITSSEVDTTELDADSGSASPSDSTLAEGRAGRTRDGDAPGGLAPAPVSRGGPIAKPGLKRLAALMRDAANGVHHLNEMGVVHRDLKPGNLMLTSDGRRVVVMDLGLAKTAGAAQELTRDKSRLLGTLRYMPPEQLQQDHFEVDRRADVYALGATLYELCCLAPLHDATSEQELVANIISHKPPVPPRKRNPEVPPDLSGIIEKATAPRMEDRYQSARELAEDLDRYIEGRPILAREYGLSDLALKWARLHWRPLAVGALALAVLVMLGVNTLVLKQRDRYRDLYKETERLRLLTEVKKDEAERARSLAEDREAEARRERERAERFEAESRRNLAEAFIQYGRRAEEDMFWDRARLFYTRALMLDNRSDARSALLRVSFETELSRFRNFMAHREGASSAVFTPGGRYLLTGGQDRDHNAAKLWSVTTGELLRSFPGHAERVTCLAAAAGGSVFVSGGYDNTVRVWSVESGKELHVFPELAANVKSVAISPDGSLLAAGSEDGNIHVWNMADYSLARLLFAGDGSAEALAFSHSGRILAASSHETIALFDPATGKMLRSFTAHRGGVSRLCFAPGSDILFSAGNDGAIRAWVAASGDELYSLSGHGDDVTALAFSNNGEYLMSGGRDRKAVLWRRRGILSRGYRPVAALGSFEGKVTAAAFGTDGLVAAADGEGFVRLWRIGDEHAPVHADALSDDIETLALSPDGKFMLSLGSDRTLKLRKVENGEWVRKLAEDFDPAAAIFSSDSRHIIAADKGGNLRAWSAWTGQAMSRVKVPGRRITALARGDDARVVAAADISGKVYIIDVVEGKTLEDLDAGIDKIVRMALSPAGDKLAALGADGGLRVIALPGGGEVLDVASAVSSPEAVFFASEGTEVLAGLPVRGWGLAEGDSAEARENEALVTVDLRLRDDIKAPLDFRAEENMLLSGTDGGGLALWSLPGGGAVLELPKNIGGAGEGSPGGSNKEKAERTARAYITKDGGSAVIELSDGSVTVVPLRRGRVFVGSSEDLERAQIETGLWLDKFEPAVYDPDNPDWFRSLGAIYFKQGKMGKALQSFDRALAMDPNNAAALVDRAMTNQSRGDTERAMADYSAALDIDPAIERALYGRGNLHNEAGNYGAARSDFERILKIDETHAGALNALAWLLSSCPEAEYRDGKKAAELARRSLELSGGESPYVLDTLAAALAETGDFESAVSTQERALLLLGRWDTNRDEFEERLELYRGGKPFRNK